MFCSPVLAIAALLLLQVSGNAANVIEPLADDAVVITPKPVYLPPHRPVDRDELVTRQQFDTAIPFVLNVYPPPHHWSGMHGNFYIKPGTEFTTMKVLSGPVFFKNQPNKQTEEVKQKQNILYLAISVDSAYDAQEGNSHSHSKDK